VNAPEDRSRGASDPRLDDDSAHGGPLRAELRTFLIADIRGYTRFTQTRGDEAAGLLAARFSEFVRSGVESRDGTLLELRGDEALVVFTSARQALRAAVELQQHFAVETRADPSLPLGVGIGIDAGEAVPVSGGYRGGALNLAARLCARAGPGEILASETVVQLAGHVEGIRAIEPESLRLKGLRKPVRAFHIVSDDDGRRMGVGRRVRRSVRRVRRPRLVLGVVGAPVRSLPLQPQLSASDAVGVVRRPRLSRSHPTRLLLSIRRGVGLRARCRSPVGPRSSPPARESSGSRAMRAARSPPSRPTGEQ
jgi:class 3 adenylate cyclase